MKLKIFIVLVVIAAAAAVYFKVSSPEWLAEFNAERAEETQAFRQAGADFAQENDQAACLKEAMERFDGCTGFACTVNHGQFLRACLADAAPSEGFCQDVPEFREEPTEDDKSWAKFYCYDRNIRGGGCRILMRQWQHFCSAGQSPAPQLSDSVES